MSKANRTTRQSTPHQLLFICICCVLTSIVFAPSSAAQSPCDEAFPLPLDQSIRGYVHERSAGMYRLEALHPGWLTIEVHDLAPKPGSATVVLLDKACRPLAAASERSNPSRVAKSVDRGNYFLAVEGERLDAGIQLYAWLAPEHGTPATILAAENETTDGGGDGGGDAGPHEPIDEWDELTRWCPWSGRLELLATFTCARQIQLDADDSATVAPLRQGDREMLELTTTEAGWLEVDLGGVTILDHRGTFVGWIFPGHPVQLPAGRWFLRWLGATEPMTFTWR